MAKFGRVLDEVPGRTRRSGRVKEVVDEFLSSGASAYEVKNWAKPISVASSLRQYIARDGSDVSVVTRGEKVYLTKGKPARRGSRAKSARKSS